MERELEQERERERERERELERELERERERELELEQELERERESMNQAERIITKFGGPGRMAKILNALPDPSMHRQRLALYRWMWPVTKGGRGGRIPQSAWPGILLAARQQGIYLSDGEISPRETPQESVHE